MEVVGGGQRMRSRTKMPRIISYVEASVQLDLVSEINEAGNCDEGNALYESAKLLRFLLLIWNAKKESRECIVGRTRT